jgi:hypothetical protein
MFLNMIIPRVILNKIVARTDIASHIIGGFPLSSKRHRNARSIMRSTDIAFSCKRPNDHINIINNINMIILFPI